MTTQCDDEWVRNGADGESATVGAGGVLVALAVVAIAVNLRPAITSVGPVLDEARESLDASATWAGLLTTIPVLAFAPAGLAAPMFARRVGLVAAMGTALGLIGIGALIRALDGPLVVLGGTLIAAVGIAIAGVLLPAVIRGTFPARIGLMTGIYTAALQGGAMVGFALTPAFASGFGGWRPAWASWALLAVLSLVVWLAAARLRPLETEPPAIQATGRSLLRVPLAWVITAFFGLQALVAFVVIGWLPQVLMDSGVSRGDAGLMLGLLAAIAIPISLLVPPFAARRRGQSGWITGLGSCSLAGILGLLIAPAAAPLLWTILLGIGLSVFSLALTIIALRARTDRDTASLSGMAQGFGYLLAGTGPFLFGLLHDAVGGWTVPFAMLTGVVMLQLVAGLLAGRKRYV